MSKVLHRNLNADRVFAESGEGVYIKDAEGNTIIDGYAGGAAVSCLGHCRSEVVEAVAGQMKKIPFLHTGTFTTEPLEDLASFLVEQSPDGLDRSVFVSGGSEAVDTSLMLARQYFLEIGQPERRHVIARRGSYHGSTVGAMSVGDMKVRRDPFKPFLFEVHHVAPYYSYRDMTVEENEEEYGRRLANELEAQIIDLEPENVAVFIAETVGGTTIGANPGNPTYWRLVRDICDKYGILLILDEVFCGVGRTGTFHACTQDGIVPDILTLAKGLGGGFQPIGAVLMAEKIYQAIKAGSGAFKAGFTYMGHAAACAGALAVQEIIRDEKLVENAAVRGQRLHEALIERFGNHHHVGDVRGRGLLQAIEIVEDRSTKAPFDPSQQISAQVNHVSIGKGLLCFAVRGAIDGVQGDHVMICPPYIINDNHVSEIVDKLGQTIDAVVS